MSSRQTRRSRGSPPARRVRLPERSTRRSTPREPEERRWHSRRGRHLQRSATTWPPRPRPAVCSSATHTPARAPVCAAVHCKCVGRSDRSEVPHLTGRSACLERPATRSVSVEPSPLCGNASTLGSIRCDPHAQIRRSHRVRQRTYRDIVHTRVGIGPDRVQRDAARGLDWHVRQAPRGCASPPFSRLRESCYPAKSTRRRRRSPVPALPGSELRLAPPAPACGPSTLSSSAASTPPASAMWLPLIRIPSCRSCLMIQTRHHNTPHTGPASRRPGIVLRVSSTLVFVPASAFT